MVVLLLECSFSLPTTAQSCGATGIAVQVLGSGGPDIRDKRASSSYLVWQNGRARVLVDAGGGSALRFGESGAQMSQLDVVLFTHFHADHSSDFPALILSSRFEPRTRDLPVYGPPGNDSMPSTTEFLYDLFGASHGAYHYLSPLLEAGGKGSYKLQPHDVEASETPMTVFQSGDLSADAVHVIHGPASAVAWRVDIGGKRIVFSGDTSGEGEGLTRLAMNADVFVAHNVVAEPVAGGEKQGFMPPSLIGQIADTARVKQLVLSHRMAETLGRENERRTQSEIRKRFAGPLTFANDLDCFPIR
jgi:ribonuclease BN (tRNA processing enzyme)